MSGASFLLIALAVAVVGSVMVVARNRPARRHHDAMADFRREMEALAPPGGLGHLDPPSRNPYPGVAPIGRAPVEDRHDDDQDPHRGSAHPDAGSGAR